MKIYIYKPGNEEPEIRDVQQPMDYKEIAAIVEPYLDGDMLEHVRVLFDPYAGFHAGRGILTDMFVGESSMHCQPQNQAASAIYHAIALRNNPNVDTHTLPPICGGAVVFERRVWF